MCKWLSKNNLKIAKLKDDSVKDRNEASRCKAKAREHEMLWRQENTRCKDLRVMLQRAKEVFTYFFWKQRQSVSLCRSTVFVQCCICRALLVTLYWRYTLNSVMPPNISIFRFLISMNGNKQQFSSWTQRLRFVCYTCFHWKICWLQEKILWSPRTLGKEAAWKQAPPTSLISMNARNLLNSMHKTCHGTFTLHDSIYCFVGAFVAFQRFCKQRRCSCSTILISWPVSNIN